LLGASIEFETREPANVSVTVLGDYPISNTFPDNAIEHTVPVLGLYPNSINSVVLTVTNSKDYSAIDTLNIQTSALPDFLPIPDIEVLNREAMEPGLHFSEVHIGNSGNFDSFPMIFDDNGDIRWVMDLTDFNSINWPVQFNNDNTFFVGHYRRVHEYNMLGEQTNVIDVAGENNIHHEVIKLPSGNYIAAVSKVGATMDKGGEEIMSVDDYIIELSSSGEILTEWDMAEILDVNRTALLDGGNDWFHMNAVWFNEDDKSLIISGRNQGVVKVNWENELQWILAPHKGWGKAGRYDKTKETTPFLLTAIDATGNPLSDEIQLGNLESNEFSWTWGQHAPMILPNGNLFIFDNGFNRNFGVAESYSLATEYQIDEEDMTVREVWSYGRERGGELFSNIISDVDYLPETQNRLFAPGIVDAGTSYPRSKIVEISYPNKEVVFESSLQFKNALANGQPSWGNLDITYRAERIKLYR
jgi:arylsulfate sulfotransferase